MAGFLLVLLLIAMPGIAEPSRVVQAEEILKKIELGQPVEYDRYTIYGDLNISGLILQKTSIKNVNPECEKFSSANNTNIVISQIEITNSSVLGLVNLNGMDLQNYISLFNTSVAGSFNSARTFFQQNADFGLTNFTGEVDFRLANFNQETSFSGAIFDKTADFQQANFVGGSNFDHTFFNDSAIFLWTEFNYTSFSASTFNGRANFISIFYQDALFLDSHFVKFVKFESPFFGYADFSGTQFDEGANFVKPIKFLQGVDFDRAKFGGFVLFLEAIFLQTSDFDSAEFLHGVDFRKAKFLNLKFDNAIISGEASFDSAQINGTLSLYRTKYQQLNIRWSSIKDLAYDDTAYHLLIQNFNKLGFGDDARECQYTYRCKHREELWRQHRFDSWLFDLLAWATYGYGLRPVRPLGWSAFFILVGGLFFFRSRSVIRSKAGSSEKRPLALRRKEEMPDGEVSIWEAFLLSATYFTSGASSIISATPTEFVPVGSGRYVVVLLRLLGWIFFVQFLSSLNRTV